MGFASIRDLSVMIGSPAGQKADLLVASVCKDEPGLSPELAALFTGDANPARAALSSGDFKGDAGETLVVYGASPDHVRVLLLGCGPRRDFTLERVRSTCASAARKARDLGVARVLFPLPLPGAQTWTREEQLTAAAEGAILGTWQFPEFKTVDREKYRAVGHLAFCLPEGSDAGSAASALHRGRVRAEGTCFARDLAATPANRLTPAELARVAEQVARDGDLRCSVLESEECERLGMGAFLAVARGSAEPPKFIVLEYDGGGKDAPRLGLVGKAITFDAGGISLKPGAGMHDMKYDMAGGGAVLGAMRCLRALAVPVSVVAAIPATENLPGGRATRPGDVVRSISGKTVEILNTDAEGRLILADALGWMVQNHHPDAVVDLATLTGAVIIALGHYGAAVLSNHDGLAARIETAARSSGERTWRLPIWDEYPDHLKGEVADLKNIADANAGGGTIAGGAFLREFVNDTPWAHVDIAGTAWWEKDRPHLPKGPSGYGVRLLLDLVEGYRPATGA
jgi:leucyl aminopeptidase